ncbi:MAG: hypothetical protein P8X73_07825 [Ignavibacteriaceae bacterium]
MKMLKSFATALVSIILLFLNGCISTTKESVMMNEMEGVQMTPTELSIRLNEFGKFFIETVEASADKIIAETNSTVVKRNALEWKINVIPQILQSLTMPDPVAAGTDVRALCMQMDQFFTIGNGRDVFGDQQYIAVKASEKIMDELVTIASDIREISYFEKNKKLFQEWVDQNPIEDLNFYRKSTFDTMAKALGSEEYGLGTTVGSIAEGVQDIRQQITFYTNFLPKHAKWQMELEMYNLLSDTTVERTINNFDRIVNSTERISKVMEESPELIKELQQSSLTELNQQLLIVLTKIAEERKIVLKEIADERIAVLKNIYQQRIETLDRIDLLVNKTVSQSSIVANDIVDKIFWRLLIILGIGFIGGIVALKFIRK